MKTTPCRGCGKPIIWAVSGLERRRIPLDPRPPVYVVGEGVDGEVVASRMDLAMVSHFATCPAANLFSGRNRKPEVPTEGGR